MLLIRRYSAPSGDVKRRFGGFRIIIIYHPWHHSNAFTPVWSRRFILIDYPKMVFINVIFAPRLLTSRKQANFSSFVNILDQTI